MQPQAQQQPDQSATPVNYAGYPGHRNGAGQGEKGRRYEDEQGDGELGFSRPIAQHVAQEAIAFD